MVRRLLITGTTGFVGRWVVGEARRRWPEAEIVGMGRWTPASRGGAAGRREGGAAEESESSPLPLERPDRFIPVDLTDSGAVSRALAVEVPSHVVHLAGLVGPHQLSDLFNTHVMGTVNLLEALAQEGRRPRVLLTSSAATFGLVAPEENPIGDQRALQARSPYGMSKAAQVAVARILAHGWDLPLVTATLFNLVGPGQSRALVPMSFLAQLRGADAEPVLKVGNLDPRRDFVDVRDAASALALLMEGGEPMAAYNVASGDDISMGEVVELIREVTGRSFQVEIDAARVRPNDVPRVQGDVSRIRQAVGWSPAIPLRTSLADMWAELGEGG